MADAKNWHALSDEEVKRHLEDELARTRASTPEQILGATSDDDARAAFLDATKRWHPNRFARRSEEIRRLANEVFLATKAAYDALRKNGRATPENSTAATAEPVPAPPPRTATAGATPRAKTAQPVNKNRQALRERRREALKARLTSKEMEAVPPPGTAARPLAQKPTPDQEFEKGLETLEAGDPQAAASIFRSLATNNPSEKRFRLYMHFASGRAHEIHDRPEDARAEYKRALGIDGSFAPALQAMANLPRKDKERGLLGKLFRR